MAFRNPFHLIAYALFALLFAGCYHMRVHPEPIKPGIVKSRHDAARSMGLAAAAVEKKLDLRIIERDADRTLLTSPRHFFTDTGFGQPPGGRKYYVQIRVDARPDANGAVLTITPVNYEIRTSYAYNQDGRIATLYKHYPYEEYPGMFDGKLIEEELKHVADTIVRELGKSNGN